MPPAATRAGADSYCSLERWRRWVLHGVRIRSENGDEMWPTSEMKLVAFGHLVACIRDLGCAKTKAIVGCLQRDSLELVCHLHFLAAITHKILGASDSAINRALSQLRICSRLRSLRRPLRAPGPPAHSKRPPAGSPGPVALDPVG